MTFIPEMTSGLSPAKAKGEHPFDGFSELVQQPLEESDPRSFKRIRRMFLEIPGRQTAPLRLLLIRLAGKSLREDEARATWRRILEHKTCMQGKLERIVGIQTAAVDYFDLLVNHRGPFKAPEPAAPAVQDARAGRAADAWIERVYAPGYHLERLREELLRAKRYRHALSAIMFDIDDFHKINERFSLKEGDRILAAIVRIVRKTARTVDIIARHSGDRFVVILPNTNKREALELAERLRKNVSARARAGPDTAVTITAAVEQWCDEEGAAGFIGRLDSMLERGRNTGRDAVYSS